MHTLIFHAATLVRPQCLTYPSARTAANYALEIQSSERAVDCRVQSMASSPDSTCHGGHTVRPQYIFMAHKPPGHPSLSTELDVRPWVPTWSAFKAQPHYLLDASHDALGKRRVESGWFSVRAHGMCIGQHPNLLSTFQLSSVHGFHLRYLQCCHLSLERRTNLQVATHNSLHPTDAHSKASISRLGIRLLWADYVPQVFSLPSPSPLLLHPPD